MMNGSKFECEVSRHDHHNLELKFNLEADSPAIGGTTELHLFLPGTVKASSWGKQELMADFFSRFRLSLPVENETSENLDRVRARYFQAVAAYRAAISVGKAAPEGLLGATQRLGALLGEAMKARKGQHCRDLFLAHALPGRGPKQALATLMKAVENTGTWVRDILKAVSVNADVPYALLLAEYVWHGYTQYLGALDGALDQVGNVADSFAKDCPSAWKQFREHLQALAEEAAAFAPERPSAWQEMRTEEAGERHLVRVSQLKKFFQSNMFVEVSRHHVLKRFTEPVAATAAGAAALWAAVSKWMEHPGEHGSSGAYLLCFGVLAYILKDRVKDRGKLFLQQKLAQFLPDQAQELRAEQNSIGKIREWFSVKKASQVSRDVRDVRHRYHVSEAESYLPEDVVHIVKRLEIQNENGPRPWAIQECLRINLERYLKHMDDPYKDMTMLDERGQFAQCQAHRVYYFHAVVKTQVMSRHRPPTENLTAVRIVMDKRGIQRVLPLRDDAPPLADSPPARYWAAAATV